MGIRIGHVSDGAAQMAVCERHLGSDNPTQALLLISRDPTSRQLQRTKSRHSAGCPVADEDCWVGWSSLFLQGRMVTSHR